MEEVGKACIDELEVKVDARYSVWWGSLYSVEERQPALLGRHCHLEKGSFFGLHPRRFRRYRQRRRCDLVREAYWIVGRVGTQEDKRKREREKNKQGGNNFGLGLRSYSVFRYL